MPSIQQSLTMDHIDKHIEILNSKELAISGRESLDIIGRCSTSKGYSRELVHMRIISVVVEQAPHYTKAIDMSVRDAHRFSTFASDAITICTGMSGQQAVADMKGRVTSMSKRLKISMEDAHKTIERLQNIRQKLFQVKRLLPTEMEHLGLDAYPSNGCTQSKTQNHLLFKMPKLHHDTGISSSSDSELQHKFDQNDLESLVVHVGHFINWWTEFKGSLDFVQSLILAMHTVEINRNIVRSRLDELRARCLDYENDITGIKSHYPHFSHNVLEDFIRKGLSRR